MRKYAIPVLALAMLALCGLQAFAAPYPGPGAAAVPGIIQAENYDTGGEGVAFHDTSPAINEGGAGAWRTDNGVDVEGTGDTGGGYNIGFVQTGEWMTYTVSVSSTASYPVFVRIATPQTSPNQPRIHLESDGVAVTPVIDVPNTNGWQTYTSLYIPSVNLTAGTHVLKFVWDAGGANLNYIQIGVVPPPPPPADTVWATEPFEYGLSALDPQGPPAGTTMGPWAMQEGTNVDAFTVVGGGATGNAAQIWFKPGNAHMNITNGSYPSSWHIEDAAYSKKIKLSFKFKPLTSVGDNFWQIAMRDWVGAGSRSYMWIQGSDTNVVAFDTAGGDKSGLGSPSQPINSSWHTMDCIINYTAPGSPNTAFYFLDGNYFFTGTSDGGYTNANRVRALDLISLASASTSEMKVLIDDVVLSSSQIPVNTITSPVPNDVTSATPLILWNGNWYQSQVAATQVRVCTSNSPTGTVVYDSGDVPGLNFGQVTSALPGSTDLYVFERDKLTSGGYNPWSAGVKFSVFDPNCSLPTVVTAPTGTIATKKPMVTVSGCPHTHLQVKVTSDAAGNTIEFDSGDITTTGNGAATTPLNAGVHYAFGRVGVVVSGSVQWNPWSAGQVFTINLAGQLVDVLHMDEANILTTDNPGGTSGTQDGFGHIFMSPGQYLDGPGTSTTVYLTDPVCGNKALFWNDRGASRSIRTHKVSNYINLDNGVTFMWAVSVLSEGGSDGGGASWRMATNLLMDMDSLGESHFIAVRTLPTGIGIITDTAAGNEATGGGFTHHWAAWDSSTDYRIIRLTGRNAVGGDYNSTVWNVYVNESPTPVLTATGCLTASIMESNGADRANGFQCDAIALGHGSSTSTGDIQFDWTAVNGTCDYAPGEWSPTAGGGSFASIGAAKSLGVEARPVSIAGSAVITKVATHLEVDPITLENITVQDAYYAQDVAALAIDPNLNEMVSGVKIVTSNTMGGAVAEGAKLTSISGVMVEQAGGRSIVNPTVTIEGTANVTPVAMSQKTLNGLCMTQSLGSSIDTTGMLVRVFGRCQLSNFDPNWGTLGAYLFYVDDGSGAIDGRETADGLPVPGIRCFADAADPNVIPPSVGDYVMIEGIAGYEAATIDGVTSNVRQLLLPTYTIVTSGI